MKKTGVLDQVLDALKGMDVLEFGGIEPNPAYETLMNAVKLEPILLRPGDSVRFVPQKEGVC